MAALSFQFASSSGVVAGRADPYINRITITTTSSDPVASMFAAANHI